MKSVLIALLMCLGLAVVIYIQRDTQKKAYAERLRAAGQTEVAQKSKIPSIPNLKFESFEEARKAYEIALREIGGSGQPVHWEAGHDHTQCLLIQDFHGSREAIHSTLAAMIAELPNERF